MQRRFSSRGGVPFFEKWGGSLAVQPRWRRRTDVWREATSPARGFRRLTSDRQRGAILPAQPIWRDPLRGQRCRSFPALGGASQAEAKHGFHGFHGLSLFHYLRVWGYRIGRCYLVDPSFDQPLDVA